MKVDELIGKKFNRLTILDFSYKKNNTIYFKCQCSCGSIKIVSIYNLKNGTTKSCGCYNSEYHSIKFKKHGLDRTNIYFVWCHMVQRCYNPKNSRFSSYGGRGITICDEWRHDLGAFNKWALANGYDKTLSIDRIDNNGNYCPENCRWATQKEQANNKRTNKFISFNGKTQTITQWADEKGLKYSVLSNRIRNGWSVERALTTPVKK